MKTILTHSLGLLAAVAFAPADAASGSGGKPTAADAKPAAAAAEKPKDKPAEPKEPKRGVGTVAMEAILNGASNEEALAAVRKEFPDANTTKASINWYRNKLRKDGTVSTGGAWKGKPVPNAREMAKAAKATAEGKGEAGKASDSKPTASDDPTA